MAEFLVTFTVGQLVFWSGNGFSSVKNLGQSQTSPLKDYSPHCGVSVVIEILTECGGRNTKQRLPGYTHKCDTIRSSFAKSYGLFDIGTTLVIYANKTWRLDRTATLGFSGPARHIPENVLHRIPVIIVCKKDQEGVLGRIFGRDSDGRNDCIGYDGDHLSKEPHQNSGFVLEAAHKKIRPMILEIELDISNSSSLSTYVLDLPQNSLLARG